MNGIHDMGGMQDMGPIRRQNDELVFHAEWERRAWAIFMSFDETGRAWTERIPPADYLRMSYYERVLASTDETLEALGLVTSVEIESGRPLGGVIKGRQVFSVADVADMFRPKSGAGDAVTATARYHVGQRVRARNINPVGHTRLPRYARGRFGTIKSMCGIEPPWDKDPEMRRVDSKPQPVYSVRSAARELWGEQDSARDSVYIDMWEDYLEPA